MNNGIQRQCLTFTLTSLIFQEFAERLGLFMHAYTCYSSVRPFGSTAIIGLVDKDGPQLYMFEPSGVYWVSYKKKETKRDNGNIISFLFLQGYKCCATGKSKSFAKTELEKLDLSSLTCREAVFEIVRILHQCHEDSKDTKDFEVEVSWVGPESSFQHQLVPENLLNEAVEKAKDVILASMDYN